LLDEEKTFGGQLKRAFRFLNNPQFDPWEVGKALFDHLTEGLKEVLIAGDWTHVGDFMILEASLVGTEEAFRSLAYRSPEVS
jgi:hypothetical protein